MSSRRLLIEHADPRSHVYLLAQDQARFGHPQVAASASARCEIDHLLKRSICFRRGPDRGWPRMSVHTVVGDDNYGGRLSLVLLNGDRGLAWQVQQRFLVMHA